MNKFFDVYREMVDSSLKLSYKGGINVDLIDSLMQMIDMRLQAIETDIKTRKKVYGIMMECIQNLFHHQEKNLKDPAFDPKNIFLAIDKNENKYSITTGNFISNKSAEKLKSSLDKISELKTSEDIQELYNEVLTNNLFSDNGGGGLGLIDIARKCNNRLDYSFRKVNGEITFYTLKIEIHI